MLEFLKNLRKKAKPLYRSGTSFNTGFVTFSSPDSLFTTTVSNPYSKGDKEDIRLDKKPVEVFKELITETPTISFENCDERLRIVKHRRAVLQEEIGMSHTPDEDEAIEYLEAARKFIKLKKNFQELFPWAVTNNALIDALIKKYKLARVDFASYYKTAPMEAIDELERFCNSYKLFCKEAPVLSLIIDDTPAEKSEPNKAANDRKKDPILLARSPFGRWWFILGTWDKEVAIVDELLYK